MHVVRIEDDFAIWRVVVRGLLTGGVAPADVMLVAGGGGQDSLFGCMGGTPMPRKKAGAARVPKAFVSLAEVVACHRDEQRWATLYRVLWRLAHGEPNLLEVAVDDDVHRLLMMEKQVR